MSDAPAFATDLARVIGTPIIGAVPMSRCARLCCSRRIASDESLVDRVDRMRE